MDGPYIQIFNIRFSFYRGFEKVIALLRNPLEAALSEYYRLKTEHKKEITKKQFEGPIWKNFALKQVKKWNWLYMLLFRRYPKEKICILRYEKLKENLMKEFDNCLNFLGISVNQELLDCILKKQGAFYHKPLPPELKTIAINGSFEDSELVTIQKHKTQVLNQIKKLKLI